MAAAIDLVVSEFVFLSVACFFLLRYYAASMISYDVLCTVYLSWVLGLAGVLFLPYDLSLAIVDNEHSAALERVWKFVYWSTFILAWIVLPIQMEFHGSGHFSFRAKLWDSLYRLIVTMLIAIVAAIIYVIYLVSTSGGTLSQVIGFVMAMGNTYGVLLLTLLMGNGLVALPMYLWRLGDVDRGLRELYMSAAHVEESFQDARYELEDCEVEIEKIIELLDKSGSAALREEIGAFAAILKDKITAFQFGPRSKSRAFVRGFRLEQIEDHVLTSKAHIIKLHARLMTAQIKAQAAERRWNVLLSECERQEMVSEATRVLSQSGWCAVAADVPTESDNAGPSAAPFSICNPWTWSAPTFLQPYCHSLYLIWSQRLFTHSCRAAAVICGLMSLLILWCEMLMSSQVDSPVGLLMTAYGYQDSSSVMVQAVSFLALMYMSLCTYWPLFRLNIGWAYQLQGPQQSSPFSLIFNAEYLSRLQFTIGYNFLMYLNVPRASKTAFNQLMSNIELIPVFGTSFAVYIPLIMILMALLTLFDGYGRLVQVLGVEWEDSATHSSGLDCTCRGRDKEIALDPQLQEKIRTGKLIVTNELKQRRAALTSGIPGSRNSTSGGSGGSGRGDGSGSSGSGSTASGGSKMRIGLPTSSQMAAMTEVLIPTFPGRGYRNVESASNDVDVDVELRNPYSNTNSSSGRSASSAMSTLFPGFRGAAGKGYANVSQAVPSPGGVGNPLAGGERSPRRDLFSIDNDDDGDNIYGGRYSNV